MPRVREEAAASAVDAREPAGNAGERLAGGEKICGFFNPPLLPLPVPTQVERKHRMSYVSGAPVGCQGPIGCLEPRGAGS